jgi:sugar phosphate isomerase/epimerase
VNSELHSEMKVGIVHFMAYPQAARGEQVVETIGKIVNDDFFGAIEVTAINDATVRAEAAQLLEASGLVVGYGGQPIELNEKLDINSLDESRRIASVSRLKLAIDEARELHASRFAVLSGPFPGEAKHADATKALIKSLDEICGYAQTGGSMPVVLEVFDRTIDKKSLIGPTSEAVALSAEVRKSHPDFGLMIDLSHLPLQFETPKESLGLAAGHVVHAHIGNCVIKERGNPLYGDLHPRFAIAGGQNGVAEVVEFLRELLAIGYIGDGKQNVVAFEVKPYGAETSDAVVAQAKRTLLEAWALV